MAEHEHGVLWPASPSSRVGRPRSTPTPLSRARHCHFLTQTSGMVFLLGKVATAFMFVPSKCI